VDLSIIAPAFNEESRLPRMLEETFDYLQRRKSKNDLFSFEVIVVDDGSTDRTTLVARELAKIYGESNLQVLSLKKNVGKGGAVQRGMLRARGKLLLMADSDAATRIDDLDFLEEKMKEIERNGCGIVVGSRAHLEDRAVASVCFVLIGF
jgi:dolichyl-phosphate beta-glucosyltransferase